jgi:hypothetical protein
MKIDSGFGRGRVKSVRTIGASALVITSLLGALSASGSSGAAESNVKLTLARNIAAIPNFNSSGYGRNNGSGRTSYPNPCVSASRSGQPNFVVNARGVSCTNFVLRAINRAHRAEGVRAMVLPTNWYQLSTQQQLFVVADLERVDRGLPAYLGMNSALTVSAQRAAVLAQDPQVASGFSFASMGGTWAGANSVLEADYGWMYEDGWGGSISRTSNIDCTSPRASGCWGHREVLLGHYTGLGCTKCELGTGYARLGRSSASYTDLIEAPVGSAPAVGFTWVRDVAPYLTSVNSSTTTSTFPTTSTSSTSTFG